MENTSIPYASRVWPKEPEASHSLQMFTRKDLFLFLGIYLFALTVPGRLFRRVLFLPIAYIIHHIIFNTTTTTLNEDWQMGHMLMIEFFTASDYLLVADIHKDLRRVEDSARANYNPSRKSFIGRLKWAIDLTLSPRGIGWTHEPVHALPPRPSPSRYPTRRSFVTSQTMRVTFFLSLFQGMRYLNYRNPSFHSGSPGIDTFPPSLLEQGLWIPDWCWRFLCGLSFALPIYAYINYQNRIYNCVLVGLGLAKPEECPDIFGSWRNAYTLRKFWGRVWHQILRRFVASHGKYLAHQKLQLRKGTRGSAYVQLYTAFLITGILHQVGEYMMTRDPSGLSFHKNFLGGGSLRFFVLQAIAIMAEDFIIAFGKSQLGIRGNGWTHFLGFLWVSVWFTWSLPVWLNDQVRVGLLDERVGGGLTFEMVCFSILWKGVRK